MRLFMPRIRILTQRISFIVPDALLQEVWTYLLKKTYITKTLPIIDEHPGPPLSQSVTGTLLALLDDYKKI